MLGAYYYSTFATVLVPLCKYIALQCIVQTFAVYFLKLFFLVKLKNVYKWV